MAFPRNASFDNYMVDSVLAPTTTTQAHNKIIVRLCAVRAVMEWQLQANALPQNSTHFGMNHSNFKAKNRNNYYENQRRKKMGFIKIRSEAMKKVINLVLFYAIECKWKSGREMDRRTSESDHKRTSQVEAFAFRMLYN